MNDDREGQEGWFAVDIHPWVFFTSAFIIIGSVALAIMFQARIGDLFTTIQTGIATGAGWFFIMTMNVILVFVLILMVSRYGDIRLGQGRENSKEYLRQNDDLQLEIGKAVREQALVKSPAAPWADSDEDYGDDIEDEIIDDEA